jgi:cobalt-zinc-cadmium efflux system outer membrane protein
MIRTLCLCAVGMILGCKTVSPIEPSEPEAATTVVKSSEAIVQAEPRPEPDLTGPVTWSMVRELVLARHAGLKAELLSRSMADARLAQVELWPNPELAVEMENIGGTSPRNEFRGTETTVLMTQPVPRPGKRDLQRQVASSDRRLAGWQVAQTKRAILLEAAQAYWTVLGMQAQVGLAQKQLAASEGLFATVEKRVQSGKDSPVEMNKARIAVADQRMRLHRVKSQSRSARVRLAAMWAGPDVFALVPGDLSAVSMLPEQAVLLEGLQTHPALIRWADAILKARAQKDLARKEGYDDWAVTGGIKRLQEEHETTGVIGLAIPLPVFNRNQGRRKEATYRLAQVRALKQDAHLRLTTALETQAIATRHTYHEVVTLQDDIVPQAKIAYERSLVGYEQGRFDYLHVLDAQRMWFDQSQRYVETLLTYGLARAQVVSLAGLDYDFETEPHEGDHDE